MDDAAAVIAIMWVLTALGSAIAIWYYHHVIDRDVYGWLALAGRVSGPEQMRVYLSNAKNGLEKHELTRGNARLIMTTPDYDMGLCYESLQETIRLAERLTAIDPSTADFHIGMVNLRSNVASLHIPAKEYWDKHRGIILWMLAGTLLAVVFLVFFIIMAAAASSNKKD